MAQAADPAAVRIKSIYAPGYSLQGEDLPVHILWSGKADVAVIVEIPKELELKRIHNAASIPGNRLVSGELKISRFEVPGYLGLVLTSKRLKEPSRKTKVRVRVLDSRGDVIRSTEREILLFRPLVRTTEIPGRVTVDPWNGSGPLITPRLQLTNVGAGTAVVAARVPAQGRVKIEDPARAGEFNERVSKDMALGFKKARADFKRHSQLLEEFTRLTKNHRRTLDAKERARLRSLAIRARRAYEANPDFRDRVVRIVAEAYFKNLEMITQVSSFLDYLNSIFVGRVVVLNSLQELSIPKGLTPVTIELQVADARLKGYPPILIGPVQFDSPSAARIPVHALFSWTSSTTGTFVK
jgi:hypothetical protein